MPKEQRTIRNFFLHAFALALTILLLYFWANNPFLANYNLQLTGILVVVYFFCRLLLKTKGLILDLLIFTAILILVLSSTGGLTSPLFFLVYFLLFTSSLLFETPITLSLSLSLTLFFAESLNSTQAALQLLSLLLITPLAIFFGKQYLKLLESQEKIKILSRQAKSLRLQGDALEASVKHEETDSLLWLTLNFKNSLLKIIHETSELLTDIGHLTWTQKEKLQSIHESAKDLLKSGEKLKEKIDKETDEK